MTKPNDQPEVTEQRWHTFAFLDHWLVAERREQPERGWIFKFPTDADRLAARLNTLEAELEQARFKGKPHD